MRLPEQSTWVSMYLGTSLLLRQSQRATGLRTSCFPLPCLSVLLDMIEIGYLIPPIENEIEFIEQKIY